jgi:hypothetical protein
MKALSIILFLFLPIATIGQKIEGMFCSTGGYAGECISFNSDNRFEYTFWTCIGGSGGNGKYELTQDSLLLFFTKSEIKRTNYFEIQDSNVAVKDSILISIQLLEASIEPVPFAELVLGLTIDPDSLNTIARTTADFDGKAVFKVPKSNEDAWISCRYAGIKPTFLKLKLEQDYQIVGHIHFDNIRVIEYEIYRYGIESLDKNLIVLKWIDEDGDSIFSTYKKEKSD